MSNLTIFDGETTREMTEDEAKQYAADAAAYKKQLTAAKAQETAKQALLDRLGITSDEARLLLS